MNRLNFLKTAALALFVLVIASACDNDDPKPFNPPTLNSAQEIGKNSFKASWTAVADAEKYLIDVSVNSSFSSTVSGYNKKEITGTSTTVSPLDPNTKYYFRVFAKKGTRLSSASVVKDVTTLP